MSNIIRIINSPFEYKFKEKGSTFLSFSFPVESVEAAVGQLEKLKKNFYDASHHCYAYKIADSIEKSSDDGEPSGTAGIRILNAIAHYDITNVSIVVVRYFGGVKFGVGHLGKAYYESALNSIDTRSIIVKEEYKVIKIKGDFSAGSNIFRILSNYGARILSQEYESGIEITTAIKSEVIEKMGKEMYNYFKGDIIFHHVPGRIFLETSEIKQ